jgi:hypothetical protein
VQETTKRIIARHARFAAGSSAVNVIRTQNIHALNARVSGTQDTSANAAGMMPGFISKE